MVGRVSRARLRRQNLRTLLRALSGKDRREDFQSYIAIKTTIMGAVHLSHPASADQDDDFVRAESCARRDGHFFSLAVQLTTTVMGADAACSGRVFIRNRWPSADTADRDLEFGFQIGTSKFFGTRLSARRARSLALAPQVCSIRA